MTSSSDSESSKGTAKVPVWDLPDVPSGQLPPHLELQRTRVFCTKDAPTQVCITIFILFIILKNKNKNRRDFEFLKVMRNFYFIFLVRRQRNIYIRVFTHPWESTIACVWMNSERISE